MAFYLDKAILYSGNGAGQPLSVVNSPSAITIAKEGSQSAATINYQNLKKMTAKLLPEADAGAVWFASPSTKTELLELVVAHTSSDTMIPVLQEESGQYKILGRPVFFTEHLPTLGSLGDIILCDLNHYAVGMRQQLRLDRSHHVYFTSDKTAIRAIIRVDGMAKLNSAVTTANGDVLSWAVLLAERA